MAALREKRLFLLDMDGTIYLDDRLFDGVIPFLQYIQKRKVRSEQMGRDDGGIVPYGRG